MRFNYTVYPSALEKIKQYGLDEKAEKVIEACKVPFIGIIDKDCIWDIVNDMKIDGLFRNFPSNEREMFFAKANSLFCGIEDYSWTLESDPVRAEKAEFSDLCFILGYFASVLLDADELWDYKKFGFGNLTDLVGSTGAFLWSKNNKPDSGKPWTSSHKGKVFSSCVTGDCNLDLVISRIDKTPYTVIDPFGSEVSYHPEFDNDREIVYSYHSQEKALLIALMKYAENFSIPSAMLVDKGRSIIDYAMSKGQRLGAASECFGNYDSPLFYLSRLPYPLGVLGKDKTSHFIAAQGDGQYGIYVSEEEELVFQLETKNYKKVAARFQKDEFDDFLISLFNQAIEGRGRTPANELVDIVRYRHSDEFKSYISKLR